MGILSKLLNITKPNLQNTDPLITPKPTSKFSDNDPTLLADINTSSYSSPKHNLPYSKICPYCRNEFDKPLTRKKTCTKCKNPVYVRTTQDLFPYSALTSEQVAHVDFYMSLKNTLMVTYDDFIDHEKKLKVRWNVDNVNTYDVLWSMFNDVELLKRSLDTSVDKRWCQHKHVIDLAAARYQAERGHDPTQYLESAFNYELQAAKLGEFADGLTVNCYGCCDACTKFHGKTFSLDFIEKNPVLPIKTCTRPFEQESKFVFCTCHYSQHYQR